MQKQFLLIAMLASCGAAQAQGLHWRPSDAQVATLEQSLTLPRPVQIKDYARHYWGEIVKGQRVIRGEYLSHSTPGIYISTIAVLPAAGGGCGFVDVTYDVAAAKGTAKCH